MHIVAALSPSASLFGSEAINFFPTSCSICRFYSFNLIFLLLANCVQIKTVMKKQTRTENCICSAHRNIALHCTARYSIRKYFLLYNNVSIFYILFWRNKEKRLDECIIILHCVFSYRYFVCKCKLR